MLLRDLTSLRWLLENLGFLINWKKSAIIPVQEIQFLGYLINAVEMMIMLPSDKIIRIAEKCQRMVQKRVTTVRKLAEILGCMTSSLQAIAPAPLHYRYLQMTQIPRSFGEPILPVEGHIDTGMLTGAEVVDLTHEGLEWQGNNKCWSRPDYQQRRVQARLGCGLRGTEDSGSMDSRGKEPSHKCFGTEGRSFCPAHICPESENVHIHLKMDNRTAVAYIQKMGGTRSAQMLPTTQEIWQFCLDREIFLSAEYLPGSLNTEADWQSRNFRDSSDWRLRVSVFKSLDKVLGPFTLDLFASRPVPSYPNM